MTWLLPFSNTVQHLRAEVRQCSHLLQELALKVGEQDQQLSSTRKEVALLLSELGQTKSLLLGINKEFTEMTHFSHKSD